jgi:hypothetical protein
MDFKDILYVFIDTLKDVAPILLLFVLFQVLIVKQKFPDLGRTVLGIVFVIVGLSLFLAGLNKALFPLGRIMAEQLLDSDFTGIASASQSDWKDFYWIYIFALSIGFATAIAEPALIAVGIKANEVSGGTLNEKTLRTVVALGVGCAIALGVFRIITGIALYKFILAGYIIVVILTLFAPKNIIPIAYDSGGVSTSTITVPIIAALGLGVSAIIPHSDPVIDGFGMIALACLFPIITVLAYGIFVHYLKTALRSRIQKIKEVTMDQLNNT